MSIRLSILLAILLLTFSPMHAQGDSTCPAIAVQALTLASEKCNQIGRNQICYGNVLLSAEGRTPAFSLVNVGDRADVSNLATLTLSPMDESAQTWGVALLSLQANLPGTLPGQNVSVLLLGDVQIENAVPAVSQITVTTTANARIRKTPFSSTDVNVLTAISSGTALQALAQDESGTWLRVDISGYDAFGETQGWVSTQVLSGTAQASQLPKVSADAYETNVPILTPLQAFTLKTGIGDASCADVPESGILIQTPQGSANLELYVNQVRISLSSTAYISAGDGVMRVTLAEGNGVITTTDGSQIIPAGTFSEIPLTPEGTAPAGAPSAPQPANQALLDALRNVLDTIGANEQQASLPQPVEISAPLPETEIEAVIQENFAPFGGLDGLYSFATISTQEFACDTNMPGTCTCSEMYQQPLPYRLKFSEGVVNAERSYSATAASADGFNFSLNSEGQYGDTFATHQAFRSVPSELSSFMSWSMAESYRIVSPTEVELRFTISQNASDRWSGYDGQRQQVGEYVKFACEYVMRGLWQRP